MTIDSGLMTQIWGPPLWKALHAITFGYPVSPTEEEKLHYKTFFMALKDVLPCNECKNHYTEFIKNMQDIHFTSREELTRWLYNLHNNVNEK